MLRILIADDHDVVRSGLRSLIESQTDWEVVAEAADGKEAVSKAIETRPNVAVLDYSMPLINGAEATRQIRARLPRTEVLNSRYTMMRCSCGSCCVQERVAMC